MTITLDAVLSSATCNVYITRADADTYVADKVAVTAVVTQWSALANADKDMYLVRATEFLDGLVTWFGDRYTSDQKLKWPRINFYVEGLLFDFGLTTAPPKVKYATVEMALFLMQQENATWEANENVTYDAVEIGPLKIDFNTAGTGAATRYFPDILPILLKDLGTIEDPDLPKTNRLKIAKLVRA